MIEFLLEKIKTDWRETLANAGFVLHPPLSVIQTAGIRGADRKVNFLIFDSKNESPLLILKIARSAKNQLQLNHEYECLQQLRAFPSIAESVPHPVGFFELNGHRVLAETFVRGIPLSLLLRRQKRIGLHRVRQDLRSALTWMELLQRDSSKESTKWTGEKLVTRAGGAVSQDFRQDLLSEIRAFEGLSIPLTASHGDFWPGNILLDRDQMGVIDWEGFQFRRSPLWDSFLFITTYARSYPWGGWKWLLKQQTFHKAFLEKNWFSREVQNFFRRCFSRAGLPVGASHLLFSEFLFCKAEAEKLRGNQDDFQWREYLSLYSEKYSRSVLRELQ